GSSRSCISIPTTGLTGISGTVVTQPHSGASWAFNLSGSTIQVWRNSSNSAANMQPGETLVFNVTATAGSPAATTLWSSLNAWSVTTGSTASTLCATSGSSYTPSLAYTVTANNAPAAPALTAPADAALTNDNTPTFTWAAAADADNDTLTYTLQVATDAAFNNLVSLTPGAGNLSALTYTPTSTLADGTYYWRVRAADDLTSGAFSAPRQFTVDTAPPATTSISRSDASPTKASTLHWTVAFSKSVTGVDASDFALAASGPTGASISNVSGSGSTYTVTASAGTGDGTLGLNLFDDDSIIDAAGNPLGGTGAGNGNVTGQAYTIDRTDPTVTFDSTPAALTNSAPADFTFHAADPTVNGVASGVASLQCSLDGAAFGACTSPLHLGALADGGHTLDVRATDVAGNQGQSTSFTWTVDTVAPEITNVSDSPDPTETNSTIDYTLSEAATVTVRVYDDQNNLVRTLVGAASQAGGAHSAPWNLQD